MNRQRQLITLPKKSFGKLKCDLCKGYLSVPPVDLTEPVCGRCNTSNSRSEAYEELAQYFSFPCIYPECGEEISWGRVKEHEERCIHKTFLCPVENCADVYKISSTYHHFQQKHRELHHDGHVPLRIIVESNKNTNPNYSDKYVFHVTFERNSFLVFARGVRHDHNNYNYYNRCYNNYPKRKYCFGVFALNSDFSNDCKFEVTIIINHKDAKSVSYTQKNKNIVQFDERNNCFKCIDRTNGCVAQYHHKHGNNFLPVNFDELDIANFENICYQIDIKSEEIVEITKSDNKGIAKKLECPICTQYMIAPIYICDTGHSLCGNCKRAVLVCPYCRAGIGDKRNFLLEELAETIKVNCSNKNLGCEFFGEINLIKNHEETCSFS